MGGLFAKFTIGGIAGLLAWMICEPLAPRTITNGNWAAWEQTFVLVMGAFIGLAVGGLDGFTRGGKRHTILGLTLGMVFGAIGLSCGHGIGGALVHMLFGSTIFMQTYNVLAQIPARLAAFIPMGICLGAAIGASSLTTKRIVQGAIGGGIGAAIAGVLFDPISIALGNAALTIRGQTEGEVGTTARAVTAVILGAAIGLFIGLVERYTRSAWLRLALGRNEGKEWSIDSAQTFIGRSEGASVPLMGDPNVIPIHASIHRQGKEYVLIDGGSPMGTYLNGQRISQSYLAHGSVIQIGGFQLQFLMKNQPAPAYIPDASRGGGYPISPQPGGYPAPGMAPYPQPGYPTGPPMQTQPGPMMGGQPTQAMPMQGQPMQGQPMPSQPTQAYGASPFHSPPSQPTMAYGAGSFGLSGGYALLAIDGPMAGQRFPVGGQVEIGREGSGIRLAQDSNASRRHAAISPGVGGVAVQDLGSTNGTFVNGQRVSQASAGPGDLIKVGSTTFRVEAA